ncbi:MAG: 3-carboxy-cis,cis-muconate cycloisomerase [Pseudomonadota bacterium]
MATDVFSHSWLSGLFADDELADCLGESTSLQYMLAVEAAYARSLGATGVVDSKIAGKAAELIEAVQPDLAVLKTGTGNDGVVVPALVQELKSAIPEHLHSAIHAGLTSQDVIDTSLVLALKQICEIMASRLRTLSDALDVLIDNQGTNILQGRTRMQAAKMITVADRLHSWRQPLATHLERLEEISPRLLVIQLGGAVGNRAAMGESANAIADFMADTLKIGNASENWHNRRDSIAEFSGWLSLVTGTLGKMGQDITLMAQQGIDEIVLRQAGKSSAMPHKRNPITAELLVTLARFNATQLSGMHHAMVHEQERSGSSWTLEWMILPQMIMTTGCALNTALKIINDIEQVGQVDP